MTVNGINISNFRNISGISVQPAAGINLIYGGNAQGKTNLLESVCLLASGRTWRANTDRELIKHGENAANLKAYVENGGISDTVETHIYKDAKKVIAINGIPAKKLGDLYGTLHTVIFTPDDLNLIKAGPSERRKFIDVELCQLSRIYYSNLKKYCYILKQRNCLLKQAKSRKINCGDTLLVWDEQLVSYGAQIIKARRDFIKALTDTALGIYADITRQTEKLAVNYKPNVSEEDFSGKLRKSVSKDTEFGITSCGPHKDDIQFCVNGADARVFGSQGQQRSVCLSVKLSVAAYIKETKGISPVLLLDDVFSELDGNRQNYLFGCIRDSQTFITATGMDSFREKLKPDKVFNMESGIIRE